jgi:prefoldin subunit 5
LNENNRKLKIEQETLVKIKKELTNRCFAWETRFEQKSKEALHLDLKLKEMNKMESLGSNPAAEAHNLAATTALRENIQKLKKSVADLEEKLLDSDNDKAKAEAR